MLPKVKKAGIKGIIKIVLDAIRLVVRIKYESMKNLFDLKNVRYILKMKKKTPHPG